MPELALITSTSSVWKLLFLSVSQNSHQENKKVSLHLLWASSSSTICLSEHSHFSIIGHLGFVLVFLTWNNQEPEDTWPIVNTVCCYWSKWTKKLIKCLADGIRFHKQGTSCASLTGFFSNGICSVQVAEKPAPMRKWAFSETFAWKVLYFQHLLFTYYVWNNSHANHKWAICISACICMMRFWNHYVSVNDGYLLYSGQFIPISVWVKLKWE